MGVFSFLSKKTQDPAGEPDVPVRPRRSRAAKSQDEEPIDPMLPEKKRARRRLIGATALVLAAIIGLPMVFDSEPKPLADDITIQIPPRDKAQGAAPSPMPLPPEPQETSRAADKPDAAPQAEAPPPVRVDQVADAVKAADKTSDKQADKPADKSPEKAAAKADDKHPEKHPEKHADKDKGRFVVQVAAVANKAKAEELQNRLKKAGLKAYSQKIGTKDGERFRIRVGPVGSREEADRIRARLGKMGLSGTVQPV